MIYIFRLLMLWLQRMAHGELSSQYYFRLKTFRQKYPTSSIQFKACFKTDVILHFDKLSIPKTNLPSYKTEESIRFENTNPGDGYAQIFKTRGKPESAKYEWIGDKLVQVICYRDKMFGRSVRISYFLMEDRFFLGEFQFQSYNPEILDSTRHLLESRFHTLETSTESDFYISGSDGGLILFNDSGYRLTVQYYFTQLSDIDLYLKQIMSKTPLVKVRNNEGKREITQVL